MPAPRPVKRRKIAIVGGGIAGLTAAYELTRHAELRRRFDVTVYQKGWRLGGKLASGRSRAEHMRNEEHGLHVWFGCYENAFRMAREVFEQWEPPPGCPIKSVEDAFLPHDFTPMGHLRDGRLTTWDFHYPRDFGIPGAGDRAVTVFDLVTRLLNRVSAGVLDFGASPAPTRSRPGLAEWTGAASALSFLVKPALRRIEAVRDLLNEHARRLAAGSLRVADAERLHALVIGIRRSIRMLISLTARSDAGIQTLATPLDFLLTVLCGMLNPEYDIVSDGDLDRINYLDLRAWLRENGALETTIAGPHVQMLYDATFQYEAGDVTRPLFEAGTAVRLFLKIHFMYKGAVLYLVRAGMGETFISPMYELLAARGVRFAFFHALRDLELSQDRKSVERLHFVRQATAEHGQYQPTFLHQGLVCWPTEPDFAQLVGGASLAGSEGDFEAENLGENQPVQLYRGRDFDEVILALAAGVMASRPGESAPCAALLANDGRLRSLFDRMNLVPTIAAQLWLNRDLRELGWDRAKPAMVGCGRPLDIWVDMSHVLDLEAWPDASRPRGAHYFCGVLPLALAESVPTEAARRSAAERLVALQLEGWGGDLWPLARNAENRFDWNVLLDPQGRAGASRLAAQYVRFNCDPSGLCDASAPGTSKLRLHADDSGLTNVTFAGTWIRTNFNSTCVEAAVMSGLAAARAVAGSGRAIIGEHFLSARARDSTPSNEARSEPGHRAAREPTTDLAGSGGNAE